MVMNNSTTDFGISYQGDALAEHTMDVRDLAPALIALGELFNRSNSLLNGEVVSVSLKVRATNPGSFELLLVLATVYQATTQFMTGDLITSAVNLKGLIFGNSKIRESLFSVFKKFKGTKPTVIEAKDGVTLKANNIELFVPTEVFRLYKDKEINRLAQVVVNPLLRNGIDKMVVKDNGRETETINKKDADNFTPLSVTDGKTSENITPEMALKLVSPTFSLTKHKWRLDDGSGPRWYSIEDQNFLDEVRNHKRRFGFGDYLICRVRNINE
jgi:hypothetical protein